MKYSYTKVVARYKSFPEEYGRKGTEEIKLERQDCKDILKVILGLTNNNNKTVLVSNIETLRSIGDMYILKRQNFILQA